jgi:heme oxygenase (biliverdin-IX-beta and delta-forming)
MNPYVFVPDYSRRLKVPLLVEDLHSLGRDAGTTCLAHQGDLPDTSTPSRVLGCLYVLEGASLGGQIIRRHIEARLDLAPERGLAFFGGYGEETAAMWRQFSRYLENYAAALDQSGEDEIIDGARQVFTKLGDWLNGERSEPGAGCI